MKLTRFKCLRHSLKTNKNIKIEIYQINVTMNTENKCFREFTKSCT